MTWQQVIWQGFESSGPSLIRILMGVGLAFLLGVLLGYARYCLPLKIQNNFLFKLLIEAPRYPPPIAWIPFVIIFAGIGELSATIIVVIGAFFPIFTNTYDGMKNIPRAMVWTARSFELSSWRMFKQVLFPAALPQIMSGLRIGLGMGWMSVIAAEMVSGEAGLGYSIQLSRMNMQYVAMGFDMVVIALIGYLLTLSMDILERRLLYWTDIARN
jgi:ABC-type nitrate/sulfonate/bicarbonate transport system permease component